MGEDIWVVTDVSRTLSPSLRALHSGADASSRRGGGQVACFEVDEHDHKTRNFRDEVNRDFMLADEINTKLGASFTMIRINPDDREMFG